MIRAQLELLPVEATIIAQPRSLVFFSSAQDSHGTPRDVFDVLHREHNFTIDAFASRANAMLPRFWTRTDNAFRKGFV